MKRIFFVVALVVFLGVNGFSQTGFFVKNSNIEKWYIKSDSVKLSGEIKKVMNIPEFHAVTKGRIAVEELLPSFHFIDFNNNGTYDLIFAGKIFNVFHVFIFYRKSDGYLLSIGEKGSIVQANLPNEDNGLNFSIWKEGCCGDFINTFTQYVSISTNNTSYFNTATKSLVYRRTILPSVRIERPVSFKVVGVANLRVEPIVDDEKQIGGKHSWKGNSLAQYSPNATGVIYAETRDAKNEFWYFVRMNNETGIYIHSNRFTTEELEDAESCFYYGWIHSKEVNLDKNE
ncbi:MAG: hypothetical protein LBE13_21810 [Bacteroidales bacterium]|jgi:hypothetical protein|nr:hypothetical protein [Bacteroidales bacterium]